MKMYKLAILFLSVAFVGAGCSAVSRPAVVPSASIAENPTYSDLSVCGDFPRSSGDGGPTSRYFVCRDSRNGDCYYKRTYPKQINGCDPKFDENPYGRDECFEQKADLSDAAGREIQREAPADVRPDDACAPTLPEYYNTKVKE